jgi:hypothetical protein
MLKMEAEPAKVPEAPTIIINHRGRRGKGEVVGNTFFRFNDVGEARIPLTGQSIEDTESLVKYSKGLASYHIEQPISLELPIEVKPENKLEDETIMDVINPEVEEIVEPKIDKEVEMSTVTSSSIYVDESDEEVVSSTISYEEDYKEDEEQSVRKPVRSKRK